jgi:hypothetical protein
MLRKSFLRILSISFVIYFLARGINYVNKKLIHIPKKRPFEALFVLPQARGLEPVSPQAR